MKADKEKVYQIKQMRKTIYDELADKLNIIYCYVNDVGDFGEYEPKNIIELKRFVDRRFKVYENLWSPETRQQFDEFVRSCFRHFGGGLGKPAPIQSTIHEKSAYAKIQASCGKKNGMNCFQAKKTMRSTLSTGS